MSSFDRGRRAWVLSAVAAFVFVGTMTAKAQDTTTTTVRHGAASFDTQVRSGQVVYVSGNHLVLKMDNGELEHFVVPDGEKFTINGREGTANDLKPGATVTQTVTTTTVPRYVTTVRTIKGTVWHVTPPKTVILTLPDGRNQSYTVPDHAKFKINGQDKTVFDLRKGMNVEATVVTDDTETVVERNKTNVAQLPPPPETPAVVGVLLIVRSTTVRVALASAPAPKALPKTATALPAIGLLGLLCVGMGWALRAKRNRHA